MNSLRLPLYLCIAVLSFEACKVQGRCSDWTDWSPCSVTCGVGIEYRNRSCDAGGLGADDCDEGPTLETKKCNLLKCKVKYNDLGCFKDQPSGSRALPELVKNLRSSIDWWNMGKTVQTCAELVNEKGWKIFGIQFYGECWSGPDAGKSYNKFGKSSQCWNGVGKADVNHVYKIT